MPTLNGTITISFIPGSEDNTVNYTVNGVPGTPIAVSCAITVPPTPCVVTLPTVTYDDPSCDTLVVEGIISPDCDPDIEVAFSQTYEFLQDCRTWTVTCINTDNGCNGFDSTPICPECIINEEVYYNGGVVDTFSNDVDNAGDPPVFMLNAGNNFIPSGTSFNLCLSEPYTLAQSLDPDYWTIEFNQDPENCCHECEAVEFTFDSRELLSGVREFPEIYPSIYFTTCEEGCYRLTKFVYFNDSIAPSFVRCVRKNSWTIMGNKYPVTVNILSTCSI